MKELKSFVFFLAVLGTLNGYQAQDLLEDIFLYEEDSAFFKECRPSSEISIRNYDDCVDEGLVNETDVESYCRNSRLRIKCFDYRKSYDCNKKQQEDEVTKILDFLIEVSNDTFDAFCKEKTFIQDNMAKEYWKQGCFHNFMQGVVDMCLFEYIEGRQTCSAAEKHKDCIKSRAETWMVHACPTIETKVQAKDKDKYLSMIEFVMKEHYPNNCPTSSLTEWTTCIISNSASKISPTISLLLFSFLFF